MGAVSGKFNARGLKVFSSLLSWWSTRGDSPMATCACLHSEYGKFFGVFLFVFLGFFWFLCLVGFFSPSPSVLTFFFNSHVCFKWKLMSITCIASVE